MGRSGFFFGRKKKCVVIPAPAVPPAPNQILPFLIPASEFPVQEAPLSGPPPVRRRPVMGISGLSARGKSNGLGTLLPPSMFIIPESQTHPVANENSGPTYEDAEMSSASENQPLEFNADPQVMPMTAQMTPAKSLPVDQIPLCGITGSPSKAQAFCPLKAHNSVEESWNSLSSASRFKFVQNNPPNYSVNYTVHENNRKMGGLVADLGSVLNRLSDLEAQSQQHGNRLEDLEDQEEEFEARLATVAGKRKITPGSPVSATTSTILNGRGLSEPAAHFYGHPQLGMSRICKAAEAIHEGCLILATRTATSNRSEGRAEFHALCLERHDKDGFSYTMETPGGFRGFVNKVRRGKKIQFSAFAGYAPTVLLVANDVLGGHPDIVL